MSRHVAGYVGPHEENDQNQAPGAWVNPTEVYEARLQGKWPRIAIPGEIFIPAGSYAFAISSGVLDNSDPTQMIPADGQDVSRTDYAELFSVLGEFYGPGDGSTTFTVPENNRFDKGYQQLLSDGNYTTPMTSFGTMQNHTHNATGATGTQGGPSSYHEGQGGGRCSFGNANVPGEATGSDAINNGKHADVYPMLAAVDQTAPMGFLITALPAASSGNPLTIQNIMPPNAVIPTGQAISRTTYNLLYEQIGTAYGVGDGTTTFNLPDYRGLFFRAASGEFNNGRPSGYREDSFAEHHHTWSFSSCPPGGPDNSSDGQAGPQMSPGSNASISSVGTDMENRPENVSCIYYLTITP